MSLLLNLPADLEQRLRREAERHGVSAAEYVVQFLDKSLPAPERKAELVALLQSWIDASDEDEQKETGDFLVQALDEDRLSERKLYPPELKDVSW